MEDKTTLRITPQFILGLIIIFVGVIFTLDNLEVLYARDYLRYWPALVLIYGLSRLLQPGGQGKMSGLIFSLIGGALLVDRLDVLDVRIWDYWPIILVIIGGTMIWRAMGRFGRSPALEGASQGDSVSTINGFAFLGGVTRKSNSRNFRGGELTAIMGGCEVDLRQADIKEGEAMINVFAFWGGVEIKVPEDWTVNVQATPLLGGIEDKTLQVKGGSSKRLLITGYAIMGGVEISN